MAAKKDEKDETKGAAEAEVRRRHTEVGTVVSDKMTRTVVVAVERLVQHPMYHKTIRRTSRFMAHDEKGAKRGDVVRIVETRPLSASKRWRVEEIIARAGAAAEETVAPAGA